MIEKLLTYHLSLPTTFNKIDFYLDGVIYLLFIHNYVQFKCISINKLHIMCIYIYILII